MKCFILAGGKSSRFKKDKAKFFYKAQYKVCKKVFKDVYFVAKRKKFKNYPFYIEKSKEYAPINPLIELLKKEKKIFILSIDTPITEKILRKLLHKKAVICSHPLVGYYDKSMLKNIKSKRIKGINKNCLDIKLCNINTKKELIKCKRKKI